MNLLFKLRKLFYRIRGRRLCIMCGENTATEQIKEPNAEQDNPLEAPMIDVCWECARFVEWGKEDMIRRFMADFDKRHNIHTKTDLKPKPFDIWLLDKYYVQPKVAYATCAIRKKNNE